MHSDGSSVHRAIPTLGYSAPVGRMSYPGVAALVEASANGQGLARAAVNGRFAGAFRCVALAASRPRGAVRPLGRAGQRVAVHAPLEVELALEVGVGRVLEAQVAALRGSGRRTSTSSPSSWAPETRRSSAIASACGTGVAVGVARGHHVVGVGDRDHPRQQRDVLADEAARVAAAVDALVVGEDDVGHRAVAVDAPDEARTLVGVRADDLPVLVVELAVGQQDAVGEGELADVVQQAGRVDELLLGLACSRSPRRWPGRSARRRPSGAPSSGRAATASARSAASTPTCSEASCVERASSCSARSCESSSSRVRTWKRNRTTTRATSAASADGAVGDRDRHGERAGQRLGRQHRDEHRRGPARGTSTPVRDPAGDGDQRRSSACSCTKNTTNTPRREVEARACGRRGAARGP